MISNVRNWVHTNITGSSKDQAGGAAARESADRDYSAIEAGYNQLQGEVDELKKPVEVSLQGSYADLSKRDKLVLGASAGAVIGGTLGLARGFLANAGDGMKLNIAWNTHAINTQRVEFDPSRSGISGIATMATADGLREVEVKNAAIRYDFPHRVVNEKVGEYRTPGEVRVEAPSAHAAAVSALGGAVAGAALGVGVSAALMALGKFQPTGEGQAVQVDFGDTRKTLAIYTGAGAAIGAGLGALDGLWEASRMAAATETVTWETPIMREGVIGHVPKPASIMVRRDVAFPGGAFNGSELYRDAAKFDLQRHIKNGPQVDIQGSMPERTLLRGIKMEEHSQSYHGEARYSLGTSVLVGALAGGVLGLAAGVTANTLQKMIEV